MNIRMRVTLTLPLVTLMGCSIVHLPPSKMDRTANQHERSVKTPSPEPASTIKERDWISYTLFFQNDSAILTIESTTRFEQLLSEIVEQDLSEVRVIGHTDTAASSDYNEQLSVIRAKFISSKLIKGGIDPSLITTEARGETDLLIRTADGISDVRNRRVTIELR